MCGPLDHLIGSLAAARIEHLQFRAGGWRRRSAGRAPAIEKNGDRRLNCILVFCQALDQFVAQFNGLSAHAHLRRERLEKTFPDPAPVPKLFGIIGHVGGYGEGAPSGAGPALMQRAKSG